MGEIEQASQPDMAAMLRLSDWTFKQTMINTLRILMDRQQAIRDG